AMVCRRSAAEVHKKGWAVSGAPGEGCTRRADKKTREATAMVVAPSSRLTPRGPPAGRVILSRPMKFTKMHGIGNDYVYVNAFTEAVADPPALARQVADRHFGIGGDGLILIAPSDRADVRMRMFNADGSESEMCGNGVRCVAKYAYDHGLTKNNPM